MTALTDYGITERNTVKSQYDAALESLRSFGFAVIDGGYSKEEIAEFSDAFDEARKKAHDLAEIDKLRQIDEHNTIRLLFSHNRKLLELATNTTILGLAKELIGGYQVLSQQNGVINPPNADRYNQGAWHRDLPYQHVVFSRPMAINALFCLDEFTNENGATLAIPASHKQEEFPSESFVNSNHLQVTAPAGSYIVLDCMCYHSGATNVTDKPRRAVNHVYTSPIIRQQIDIPAALGDDYTDDSELRALLGYNVQTPRSVKDFLEKRKPRN